MFAFVSLNCDRHKYWTSHRDFSKLCPRLSHEKNSEKIVQRKEPPDSGSGVLELRSKLRIDSPAPCQTNMEGSQQQQVVDSAYGTTRSVKKVYL